MDKTKTKIITERENGTKRVMTKVDPNSLTEQHHGGVTNIQKMLRDQMLAGMNPEARPHYGDISTIESFEDVQNRVKHGEQKFMELPSFIRKKFNNNPAVYLDFIFNDNNYDEAVEMGLVTDTRIVPDKTDTTPPEPSPDDGKTTT